MLRIGGTVVLNVLCLCLIASATLGQQRVGVVLDGPWDGNDDWRATYVREIQALTEGEFDVRFPDELTRTAQWNQQSVAAAIDALLADPQVDMILGLGVLASHELAQRGPLPKPAIAPYIIDAALQGLPRAEDGIRNLHYLDFPDNITRDVTVFGEVVPIKHLALLGYQGFVDAIPGLADRTRTSLEGRGFELDIVTVGNSIDDALARLPESIDAVYITSLLHLPEGEFQRLLAELQRRQLPSFALLGEADVERGVLMTLYPRTNLVRKARRVALSVQRILLGDAPENLPSAFAGGERLILNMDTANAIDLVPSWGVLSEAKLLGGAQGRDERQITLEQAVREAVARNRDVAAAQKAVAVAGAEVSRARSALFPQIDIGATGVLIDEDRAGAVSAQRTLSGLAQLTQLLWSEAARANLSIQGRLRDAEEAEYERVRLDIYALAAQAYLNVLRAKTFERIQAENVKLSRSNLELARARQSLGMARTAEVLRWESQIATNRRDAISANAQRNQAEIALNQLLHRPLEEGFETAEVGLEDEELLRPLELLTRNFENKRTFRELRERMAQEALASSPEIAALDALIAAQQRAFGSTKAAFWSPTLALRGDLTRRLTQGGVGSATVPGAPDDTDWSLALDLSFPLFQGGDKFAARGSAYAELQQLRRQREALAKSIEARVRVAMHASGASYAGIREARAAASAARQTMTLVTDAYSTGATDILDVLDAQNAALIAEQSAANAAYDFLLDLTELERSIGRAWHLMDEDQRNALFRQIEVEP